MMKKNKTQTGFTLIELLVVTAIIGVLAVVSATVFNSILKSQNKTAIINEARQNGNILIDKFERDVRQATSLTQTGAPGTPQDDVTVNLDSGNIIWTCTASNITRGPVGLPATPLLNTDIISGVEPTSVCNFTVLGTTNNNQLVKFKFDLKQRNTFGSQFEVLVPFEVSVGTRLNR